MQNYPVIDIDPTTTAFPYRNGKQVVYLVSCGKRKSEVTCRAQDMYNSERFQLSRERIIQIGCPWYIISAKYGLLSPDEVITPYDLSISSLNCDEKEEWNRRLITSLKEFPEGTLFVIWADAEYSTILKRILESCHLQFICPFESMPASAQVSYLQKALHINEVRLFYERLAYLAMQTDGIRKLKDCNGRMYWPSKGVYFIIDFNEENAGAWYIPKVIRVGTHAVSSNSKSTLWGRIKTHKGDLEGSGSHRSSVFRLHVGKALINKNHLTCETWGIGQSATREVREKEKYIERMVSDYIGNLGVIFIEVDDEASAHSDRAFIEKNAIALLSANNFSLENTSSNWLGKHSHKAEIRGSNLWNVNYVESQYDSFFLELFDKYLLLTICNYMR